MQTYIYLFLLRRDDEMILIGMETDPNISAHHCYKHTRKVGIYETSNAGGI